MPPKAARKPKAKASSDIVETPAPVITEVVPEPPPVAAPAPAAKKGKKPVKVVAVVTPDGIEGTFTVEPRRPLIAHLQIRPSEVQFHEDGLQYDPNPPGVPEPYNPDALEVLNFTNDATEINYSSEKNETEAAEKESLFKPIDTGIERRTAAVAPAAQQANQPLQCFVRADLMVQFREASAARRLPASTEIACFWCCHSFQGQPCIIPEREVAGLFHVYGNFCCPECAMAYVLSENIDPHVRWERIALLHRLYDTEKKGRIHPAAPRETLKLFGGPMTIESFRATTAAGKVRIDMHMPPMVSILGSIDTKPIDFFDVGGKLGGGLREAEKIQKAEEGLRLRRTKPLKDRESTLDTVMNIQVRGISGAGNGR